MLLLCMCYQPLHGGNVGKPYKRTSIGCLRSAKAQSCIPLKPENAGAPATQPTGCVGGRPEGGGGLPLVASPYLRDLHLGERGACYADLVLAATAVGLGRRAAISPTKKSKTHAGMWDRGWYTARTSQPTRYRDRGRVLDTACCSASTTRVGSPAVFVTNSESFFMLHTQCITKAQHTAHSHRAPSAGRNHTSPHKHTDTETHTQKNPTHIHTHTHPVQHTKYKLRELSAGHRRPNQQ
jgi:hypothetical protein